MHAIQNRVHLKGIACLQNLLLNINVYAQRDTQVPFVKLNHQSVLMEPVIQIFNISFIWWEKLCTLQNKQSNGQKYFRKSVRLVSTN